MEQEVAKWKHPLENVGVKAPVHRSCKGFLSGCWISGEDHWWLRQYAWEWNGHVDTMAIQRKLVSISKLPVAKEALPCWLHLVYGSKKWCSCIHSYGIPRMGNPEGQLGRTGELPTERKSSRWKLVKIFRTGNEISPYPLCHMPAQVACWELKHLCAPAGL